MNKKIRLSYIILSAVFLILAASVILFLSIRFYKKTGAASAPSSQKIPVTEYISLSELTDENTLTAILQEEVPTNP